MAQFIALAAVVEQFEKPTAYTNDYLQALIDRAERLLLAKAPWLSTAVHTGAVDPALVADIIISAVHRVMRNPEGITREAEGDYSYQINTFVSSGRLFYTDDEIALLQPSTSEPVNNYGVQYLNLPASLAGPLGWLR